MLDGPCGRKKSMKTLSACGRVCTDCPTYMKDCLGCYHTRKVKILEPEPNMCPIYECAMSKYDDRNCSICPELPCDHYSKCINPAFTDIENIKDINLRVLLLKSLREKNCDTFDFLKHYSKARHKR